MNDTGNFYTDISQQITMMDKIHPLPAMDGPAAELLKAVGPVGWIIVAVLIILSPTIFTKYIWPWLFPRIAPYVAEFYLFMDEFEPEEKKQLPQYRWKDREEVKRIVRERMKDEL